MVRLVRGAAAVAGGEAPDPGDQGASTRRVAAAQGVVSPSGAARAMRQRQDKNEGTLMAEQKTQVILGTATPGGGFPLYGDAVTAVINEIEPSLAVAPRNTKGSTENIPLLEAGTLDIALVTGEPAYDAFAGIGRARTELKILAAMYSTPGMFVLRADNPARAIGDLKGRPVAFGARGSGLVILARFVLDGLGLDMERDFTAIYLDRAG